MVDGERIWPVPSLGFRDGAQSPAVALFVDRARAVAPDFDAASDTAAITEICRRLDGIPLAIELAAARVRAMSPTQIRDRLDERFRLLTGGARRALERHQTLRHAVQWSYDLLTTAERTMLARVLGILWRFLAGSGRERLRRWRDCRIRHSRHMRLAGTQITGQCRTLANRHSLWPVGDDQAVCRGTIGRNVRRRKCARPPRALLCRRRRRQVQAVAKQGSAPGL